MEETFEDYMNRTDVARSIVEEAPENQDFDKKSFAIQKQFEEDQRKIDELKLNYGDDYKDLTKYKRIPTSISIDDAINIAMASSKKETTCSIRGTENAAATALHFLQKVGAITDRYWIRFNDSPIISVEQVQKEAKRRWSVKMAKGRAYMNKIKNFK